MHNNRICACHFPCCRSSSRRSSLNLFPKCKWFCCVFQEIEPVDYRFCAIIKVMTLLLQHLCYTSGKEGHRWEIQISRPEILRTPKSRISAISMSRVLSFSATQGPISLFCSAFHPILDHFFQELVLTSLRSQWFSSFVIVNAIVMLCCYTFCVHQHNWSKHKMPKQKYRLLEKWINTRDPNFQQEVKEKLLLSPNSESTAAQ